jgi:mycofactocin system glycosyltransferase
VSTWRPDPGVRLLREGRVVVGGSPWRALVLSREHAAAAVRLWAGEQVDEELVSVLVSNGLATPLPPAAQGGAPQLEEVTLVVPVHNDGARVEKALRSVPAGITLLVVDDGSTDDSGDVARRAGATVLRHDVARGPAAARNTGLRSATTPYVAFLDADVEADPRWLSTLLPHLASPGVAMVAPRIVAMRPEEPALLSRYETAMSPLDRGPEPAVVAPRGRVDYVPTAALLVRRQTLLDVGGLDESLQLGEDVELSQRLHAAGWEVRYDPAAEVRHDHRTTWLAWLRRRRAYGSGAPAVAVQHGSPHPPVPTGGALAAAWVLFGPGRLRSRLAVAVVVASAGAAHTAASAVGAGVPAREAVDGGLRRELAGAQRVVGMLPRQGALPLAAVWMLLSRRGRAVVPAAVALQNLKVWRVRQPEIAPASFVLMRVMDEGALGVGVLAACWRARSVRALLPPLGGPRAVRRAD